MVVSKIHAEGGIPSHKLFLLIFFAGSSALQLSVVSCLLFNGYSGCIDRLYLTASDETQCLECRPETSAKDRALALAAQSRCVLSWFDIHSSMVVLYSCVKSTG